MPKILVFLSVVSFLSGCSTLTLEHCQSTNWGAVGYKTALDGRLLASAIQPEHRQCDQEYGVRPDFRAIKIGYNDGLKKLCSRIGGRELGRTGGSYRNTCSAETETDFLAGYQLGRIEYAGDRIHQLENEVDSLRSQISDRDNRINSLESQVNTLRQ